MNLAQALQRSAHIFSVNGLEDSYVEARILLGHITKLSPAHIFAHPEQTLSPEQERNLQQLIERRSRREPSAYIVNRKEFYGIDFYVDSRVLIPRPETETLVEAALEFARDNNARMLSNSGPILIADVGTGCGAIAISLALNLPQSRVYATDISSPALEVARINCEHHEVKERVILLQGNLLEPVPGTVDIIIANLPYIKSSELTGLAPEIAEYEPRIALDGGRRGLHLIRRLLEQAVDKINPRGCLLLEIAQKQEKEVVSLICGSFKKVEYKLIPDFNGIKRVVKATF